MWCLVVVQLLRKLSKVGIFARAYADDVIIICRADDKEVLFSFMRFALGMVEKWCYKVKLSVNPSEAVFFTSRYKVGSLRKLTVCGREITVVKEAKYLRYHYVGLKVKLEKSLENGMREGHASLLDL